MNVLSHSRLMGFEKLPRNPVMVVQKKCYFLGISDILFGVDYTGPLLHLLKQTSLRSLGYLDDLLITTLLKPFNKVSKLKRELK